MRAILIMILAASVSIPLWSQEAEKPKDSEVKKEDSDGRKPDAKNDAKADDTKKEEAEEPQGPKKLEMTAEGKLLLEDAERVYSKYNKILIDHANATNFWEPVKDAWETAVKEAKNAIYKDVTAFTKAITEMKREDKVFKKEMLALVERKTKELTDAAEALRKNNEK